MESLCVVSEEKVWCIRLDLKVLNHDGNAADACSVAGLAALCHFRRPDVSLKVRHFRLVIQALSVLNAGSTVLKSVHVDAFFLRGGAEV